jgi:pimeloyl-ACP methyl ester carboxylesterase
VACRTSTLAAGRLALTPCEVPGVPGTVRCGTYEVPENRSRPQGAKVRLRVVVLPATGAAPAPDPVVPFAGGPGASVVDQARIFATRHAQLRANRDVVLVDLRGTGGSEPLVCPELKGERGIQGALDEFMPVAGVRACRARYADRDLSHYRTAVAVDDVAEVLSALGYRKVNAWGVSYGTHSALTLAGRHPKLVRTLGLIGVVPPDARSPLTYAGDAQTALDATLRACAADAECGARFPRVREELAAVLEHLERQPVDVAVRDAAGGEPRPLRLSRQGVAQTIRAMLYRPVSAAQVPLAVHAAAAGDFQHLADAAATFGRTATSLADGFYLSIMCSEHVPLFTAAEAASAGRGIFLGDFRIRAQQAGCVEWGVPPAPAGELVALATDVPALLFSGERDPVTPPRWGEQVAKTLPGARHVVVPGGAHGFDGMGGVRVHRPPAPGARGDRQRTRPGHVVRRGDHRSALPPGARTGELTGDTTRRPLQRAAIEQRIGAVGVVAPAPSRRLPPGALVEGDAGRVVLAHLEEGDRAAGGAQLGEAALDEGGGETLPPMPEVDRQPQQLGLVERAAKERVAHHAGGAVLGDEARRRRLTELGGELLRRPRLREGDALERRHRLRVGGQGVPHERRRQEPGGAQRRRLRRSATGAGERGSTGFGTPGTVTGAGAR